MNSPNIIENPLKKTSPFLRWAGGKRWLTTNYGEIFPKEFNHYFEPFLGGASVFFHLQPTHATLTDLNPSLIATYKALKDDWRRVQDILSLHKINHSNEYYYKIREYEPADSYEIAARFIYLNRTCWNGLYRVNGNGKFNVPIGTPKNVIREGDDFHSLSKRFENVNFYTEDFEITINKAQVGDFIFADPPYTVKHNYNGFIGYNEKIFHWDDQIRLSESLIRAKNRGCLIMLTNANHSSVKALYKDEFKIQELSRSSTIAGISSNRGFYEEIVVTSY
jgi:DNA adenine methylase